MITRSAFKRTLEESSSDVNNNKQQQNQQPPKGKKQKKMKSLKKDDGKKKEYRLNVDNQHNGRRLFLNHRPFTFQERMDYNRRIKQSGGFDVGDFPDNINSRDMPIRPYYVPDKLGGIEKLKMVENCSKLAMDKYNKDNETKYQFGKVLKANSSGCWSESFYITCESKHVPGSRPKKFQFIVNVYQDVPKVLECSRVT